MLTRTLAARQRGKGPRNQTPERDRADPVDHTVQSAFSNCASFDLSQVRVHSGEGADRAARALSTEAFALDRDIVLGDRSSTMGGAQRNALLAHELTHLIQQGRKGTPLADAWSAEAEANRVGRAFALGTVITPTLRTALRPAMAEPPAPRNEMAALSQEDLLQRVLDNRGFESAAPKKSTPGANVPPEFDPKGLGQPLGRGYQTFGAAEVITSDGKRQILYEESFFRGGADLHAEEHLIAALERRSAGMELRGAILRVAVDQQPCGPEKHNCLGKLRLWAKSRGAGLEVVIPDAPNVSPKTAARNVFKRYAAEPSEGALPSRVRPRCIVNEPAPEGVGGGAAPKVPPRVGAAPGKAPVEPGGGSEPATSSGVAPQPGAELPGVAGRPPGGSAAAETIPEPGAKVPSVVPEVTAAEVPEVSAISGPRLSLKSVGGVVLGVAVELAISIGISLLLSWLQSKITQATIERDIIHLRPRMLSDLDKLSSKILELQKQGRVFANITLDVQFLFGVLSDQGAIASYDLYQSTSATVAVGGQAIDAKTEHSDRLAAGQELVHHIITYPVELVAGSGAPDPRTMTPEYRAIFGLTGDTEIRDWLNARPSDLIRTLPASEKVRLVNRLLDGWVSDEDVDAIRKIATSVKGGDDSRQVRHVIEERASEVQFGHREQLRIIAAQMA
jgi:hypothetical protein